LMQHYGIRQKFVNVITQLYDNFMCKIIYDGKLTDPISVKTGVRQGCLLSPMIFLMAIDRIMRRTTTNSKSGIQWTLTQRLQDLNIADNECLLLHKQQLAESKLNRLTEEAGKTGLNINIRKTELMKVNNKQYVLVKLQRIDIKETDNFTYLVSIVNTEGGADEDIKSRISRARIAFNILRPIWKSSALSLRNKIRIFNTNVKAVLLYGSETWKETTTNANKLQTFINRCLRHILNIRWPSGLQMKVSGKRPIRLQ
jgi:hypothetical protein